MQPDLALRRLPVAGLIDLRTIAIAQAIEEELDEWSAALAPRDGRRVDASCHVDLVRGGERWAGHTRSLGVRGALVATHLEAALGTQLDARIHLPTGRTIHALARVAGHQPPAPGGTPTPGLQLVFSLMSQPDRRRLTEVVHVMSGELWSGLGT